MNEEVDDDEVELSEEAIQKIDEACDLFQRIAQTALMNLSSTAESSGELYVGNLVVQELGRLLGSVVFEVCESSSDPTGTAASALEAAINEAQETIKACCGQKSSVSIVRRDIASEMLDTDSIKDL